MRSYGITESIQALSKDTVKKFYNKWYIFTKMVLIVVGELDESLTMIFLFWLLTMLWDIVLQLTFTQETFESSILISLLWCTEPLCSYIYIYIGANVVYFLIYIFYLQISRTVLIIPLVYAMPSYGTTEPIQALSKYIVNFFTSGTSQLKWC